MFQKNGDIKELVAHLKGHIQATLENHAMISKWGPFHRVHTPHLVKIYRTSLDYLQSVCAFTFDDIVPIKPNLNLAEFQKFTKDQEILESEWMF